MPKSKTYFLAMAVLMLAAMQAFAQWEMQESHTTASLRGIHSVDGVVAWASGTDGTVLRTVDGGKHWEKCAVPQDAEKLDFRGIWAWDAMTAEVMSAGPGEASRLYKTTDGCQHWREESRNTDKDGFWDSFAYYSKGSLMGHARSAVLIGDPVQGHFHTQAILMDRWFAVEAPCAARADEAAFAASNSAVFVLDRRAYILVTGGKGGPRALISEIGGKKKPCSEASLPLASGNESSGAFSVHFRDAKHGVVVGGDYKKPGETAGTAAFTSDGGRHWTAATEPPHGYRSSVAWYPEAKAWVAAGSNGSDISIDGGKTWKPLENGNWNALSPPFVVGPQGRIGKWNPAKTLP